MTDVVVLSLEPWDTVWRRNQHLMSGLLRAEPDLRVLFVEPPVDPLHEVRRGRRPRTGHALRPEADRLFTTQPAKWLPHRIDPQADARVTRGVRRDARTLGMSEPVLWVNDPTMAAVARDTGWPTLYDMTDDWLAARRPAAELARIAAGEGWLLEHAAVVVACSAELIRRKSAQRSDIALVHNGVDCADYLEPRPRPADAPAEPYALYVGTLHRDRLDVDLCVQTARALQGRARLVLVGPEAWSRRDAELVRDAGIVVLGARDHRSVPAYMQHADVLLVPHIVDAFTDSLDPIKLYEYRTVGRPIVSTPVAGFRDAPKATITDRVCFPEIVARAVPAATRFPAGADAEGTDWSARIAQVQALLPR